MIGRRRILGAAGAVAAASAAAALASPAVAQQRFTWRMVTPWPRNSAGPGMAAQRIADSLTRLSGGRLTVTLHSAGELVAPFKILDAVMDGTADLLHGTAHYWVEREPALHWFIGIPFGLTAPEMAGWMRFGGGQALWEETYAPMRVVPFWVGSSGVQSGGWFRREINSLADLSGVRMRIAGLGAQVMELLGVETMLLPPGDILKALEEGRVDAAEWIGPWNDFAFGLHKAAPYCYQPGVMEPSASLEVLIRRDRLDALPADLRDLVTMVTRAAAFETMADFAYHNASTLPALLAAPNVAFKRWPDQVMRAMAAQTRGIVSELVAAGPLATRIDASFRQHAARARQWAAWSDLGVLQARDLLAG